MTGPTNPQSPGPRDPQPSEPPVRSTPPPVWTPIGTPASQPSTAVPSSPLPSSSPTTPPASPSPSSSRREFWVTVVAIPAALAVIAIVITFVIAPWQEVRSQRATESEEERELAKEEPVKMRVTESWNDDTDLTWILDRPLSSNLESQWDHLDSGTHNVISFAKRTGGVRIEKLCKGNSCNGSQTTFRLTLTGNRKSPVEITGIKAKVHSRKKSPSGGYLEGGMGGSAEIESGVIDLDSADRRLRAITPDGKTGPLYFGERYVTLQQNEILAFQIMARSFTFDYRWELILNLSVDGKSEEMRIRANGTPDGPLFRNPGRIHRLRTYGRYYSCGEGPTCQIGPGSTGFPDEFKWD